jgi:hypothetical protein
MSTERHYFVRHYRDGDNEHVWVGDERNNPNIGPGGMGFSRNISLRWRWWQPASPAERLRKALNQAQKFADKLNHQEMYLAHEREIGVRR